MSVVAPSNLEEVYQAVQVALEQPKGLGAEDVLKELLERVVEAALGQAEGRDEATAVKMPESYNQSTEEEIMGERRDDNVEKTRNVSKCINVGKAGAEGKGIAGPMEEAPAYLETEGTEEEEVEYIIESPVTEVFQEVGETTCRSLLQKKQKNLQSLRKPMESRCRLKCWRERSLMIVRACQVMVRL